jgi:hypothetical protein
MRQKRFCKGQNMGDDWDENGMKERTKKYKIDGNM